MANSINLTESGDSSLHRLAALRLDIYHKLTGQCLKWIRKFLSLLKEIKKWCKVEEKKYMHWISREDYVGDGIPVELFQS